MPSAGARSKSATIWSRRGITARRALFAARHTKPTATTPAAQRTTLEEEADMAGVLSLRNLLDGRYETYVETRDRVIQGVFSEF